MANKKTRKAQATYEAMVPDADLRAQLTAHLVSGERLLAKGSPFATLLQGAINAILDGEAEHHLAQERLLSNPSGNKLNGTTPKQLTTEFGKIDIVTPRDRTGTFEPQLVPKRTRALAAGLDEQIIALYAQGNSVEDTRRLVERLYGIEVSAGYISAITDKVWDELEAWRARPLHEAYAVIYLDAVFFRVRTEGTGSRGKGSSFGSRASFTVYAIDFAGNRDILGIYIMESEGAMAWGRILEDLQRRGVREVFCMCVDGLKGFGAAIREVFPRCIVQRCIVHQVRYTTRFCADADVKEVRRDLRLVYTAATEEQARAALEAFAAKWDSKYPKIAASWGADWDELMAYMAFPEALRRIIYTTNPVEAVHRILRKLIKGKAAWSSESALIKQLYVSLMHNTKSWQRRANYWKKIQLVFEHYDDGYWMKYVAGE